MCTYYLCTTYEFNTTDVTNAKYKYLLIENETSPVISERAYCKRYSARICYTLISHFDHVGITTWNE